MYGTLAKNKTADDSTFETENNQDTVPGIGRKVRYGNTVHTAGQGCDSVFLGYIRIRSRIQHFHEEFGSGSDSDSVSLASECRTYQAEDSSIFGVLSLPVIFFQKKNLVQI